MHARAKRPGLEHDSQRAPVTDPTTYSAPDGILGLTGPVAWPDKGTLPLRRDLAHIALASRFLVAHYAIPSIMHIGDTPSALLRSTNGDEDVLLTLEPGAPFEALDVTNTWVWGCVGPDGPSGYVKRSAFAQ